MLKDKTDEKNIKTAEKRSIKETVSYWVMLNIGILMMAVGIYFFKAPNGFATGGVSGISIVLAKLVDGMGIDWLTQANIMLVINILLLVVGFIILGKDCGIMTVYCSILLSLENRAFELFIPLDGTLTANPLLELVYAVLLTGIGAAMIFKCKASSGGTDIVALILKKYTDMDVGRALLFSDILIAASTFIVYQDIQIGLFAILGLFAKVFIVDDILDSINMCKSFMIITAKAKDIEDFITEKMHRGATVYNAKGVYSGEDKEIIITVVRRSEAIGLRREVKKIDPSAFIIITKTSEIMGKGFRDNVN